MALLNSLLRVSQSCNEDISQHVISSESPTGNESISELAQVVGGIRCLVVGRQKLHLLS